MEKPFRPKRAVRVVPCYTVSQRAEFNHINGLHDFWRSRSNGGCSISTAMVAWGMRYNEAQRRNSIVNFRYEFPRLYDHSEKICAVITDVS